MQENTPTPKSDSIPTHDLDEYPEDTVEWILAWLEIMLNGEAYVGDPNNLKRLPDRSPNHEQGQHDRVPTTVAKG